MNHKPANKRDPIKKSPLRDPGQSLREKLDDIAYQNAVPWMMFGVGAIFFAALEWYRWFFKLPVNPILFTIICFCIAGFSVWKVRNALRAAKPLQLGLKGERHTGQFLQEELSRRGYDVLHDICFDSFNIDHVAIGPGGVFVIETKTRMKPGAGAQSVTYDGQKILVAGHKPDRDPIIQARANAKSISEIVREYSGHSVNVRPVVLFPGWFVEPQPKGVEVWVLNEKSLIGFIENEPPKLAIEQKTAIVEGVKRYVRSRDSAMTK